MKSKDFIVFNLPHAHIYVSSVWKAAWEICAQACQPLLCAAESYKPTAGDLRLQWFFFSKNWRFTSKPKRLLFVKVDLLLLASWPAIYSKKLIHAVLIYRNKDYKIRKLDSRSTSHYLHSVNMIMSCCCCLFVCFEFCLGTWWCMSSLDKKDQKTGRFFMTTMRPGDLVGNRKLWGL